MTDTLVADNNSIAGLIQRTLNFVDSRLVDHGKRVAFIVSRMLAAQGNYSGRDIQDICIIALLHDIGAYKTEEISRLTQFETVEVWEHSVYGYLFLNRMSPLAHWAEAILFHHVPLGKLPDVEDAIRETAQMLYLADRVDMFWRHNPVKQKLYGYLERAAGTLFMEETVELFRESDRQSGLLERLDEELDFQEILPDIKLDEDEIERYLKMLTYAIDFRSQHTVTHTITTTSISSCIARYMGLTQKATRQVYYGALLHDLGKIGIPVEILEYPGKLSPQAMEVMKTHVNLTEKILYNAVDETVTKIALRHHEKLDGSGYPLGLKEADLTLEEQIVAVSDIVSALLGARSYKEAYTRDRTLKIVGGMAAEGKLNLEVVHMLEKNFDAIVTEVLEKCTPIIDTYYGIQAEYQSLLAKYYI